MEIIFSIKKVRKNRNFSVDIRIFRSYNEISSNESKNERGDYRMCVGERIKAYMNEKGIKQVFVSQKTGISKEKLCSSLNGNRKLQFEEYELICGALEVNTDKFIKPKKL